MIKVFVDGNTKLRSGSSSDLREAAALEQKIQRPHLWVRRGDQRMIITDAKTLAPLWAMLDEQKQSDVRLQVDQVRLGAEVTRAQVEITQQQAQLAQQQAALGREQAKLAAQHAEVAKGARSDELGRRQGELGRRQGELARRHAARVPELVDRIADRALALGTAQVLPSQPAR